MADLVDTEAGVLTVAEDPDHDEVIVEVTDLDVDEVDKLDAEIRRRYLVRYVTTVHGLDRDAWSLFRCYTVERGSLKRD